MAKTFTQLREDITSKPRVKLKSSPDQIKDVKPEHKSTRLGGGKEILPPTFLKPTPKNPWQKTKPRVLGGSKPENKKPEQKSAPVKPKPKKGPTFAQRVDKAGEVAKQSVHAGLSRPKAIGHVAAAVAKPVAKAAASTSLGAAKLGAHALSSINKGIKRQAHSSAVRQSKSPVEH